MIGVNILSCTLKRLSLNYCENKFITMKLKLFLATLLITNFSLVINAQFDDLYYDPNKDAIKVSASDSESDNNVSVSPGFDDESYSYYDEINDNDYYNSDYNDYQYSTRIRRFNRPSTSIAYYSPIWGFGWRDPYYNPYFDNYNYGNNAVVVVIGNSWGWNRWNRWNSWNNCSYNNWGWNNNNCGFNNWGYSDWGWNNNGWGNNYCVNNYYNHGGWNNGGWNNGGWNNNGGWHNGNNGGNNGGNNNPHGTYYGSRKSGSSIASTKGRVEGPRKQTTNTNPDVRPDGLTKNNDDNVSSGSSPRSEKSRTNLNEVDKTADKPEKSSIYNRKRGDVSDRSEKYKSDFTPAPKRNNTQESDKTTESSSRREEKSSSTSRRSNDESSRSSQSSGRSYDGGSSSRSSGSTSSGSSSSRSSSGSSGSSGRSSSRRGGGK